MRLETGRPPECPPALWADERRRPLVRGEVEGQVGEDVEGLAAIVAGVRTEQGGFGGVGRWLGLRDSGSRVLGR